MTNSPTLDMVEEKGWSFSAIPQETVSGGQLVKAMSATAAGTSRPDQILEVALANAAGDIPKVVGIATTNAASGGRVTVATEGIYRMPVNAAVTAGDSVGAAGTADADSVTLSIAIGSTVGRCLNHAVSGEKTFVLLRI